MPTMSIEHFRKLVPPYAVDGFTKRGNPFALGDGNCFIGLTKGQVCRVDPADFELVSKYRWYASKDGNTYYAKAAVGRKQKRLKMHRVLCPTYKITDHINRNGLDNRRCNLREVTSSENAMNRSKQKNNTSGFTHVVKHGNRWRGQITIRGQHINVGTYALPEEASVAVDAYLAGNTSGHAAGVADGATEFVKFARNEWPWASPVLADVLARFRASRPAPGTGLCAHTADPLQVDCEKCPVHDGCTPGEYGSPAPGTGLAQGKDEEE
jgi:hypothetical protein